MSSRYTAEVMSNGLIRVYDHRCLWDSCYNMDGSFAFGEVTLPASVVLTLAGLN